MTRRCSAPGAGAGDATGNGAGGIMPTSCPGDGGGGGTSGRAVNGVETRGDPTVNGGTAAGVFPLGALLDVGASADADAGVPAGGAALTGTGHAGVTDSADGTGVGASDSAETRTDSALTDGVSNGVNAAGSGSPTSADRIESSAPDGVTAGTEAGVAIDIIGRSDPRGADVPGADGTSGNAAPGASLVLPNSGDWSGGTGAAGCGAGVAHATDDDWAAPNTPGVDTDGVGRESCGVPLSIAATKPGVPRRIPGMLDGALAGTTGTRSGVGIRDGVDALVSGVVAPSVIRRMAPQTLQRARTPFGGTLAGSTRNTDRQS